MDKNSFGKMMGHPGTLSPDEWEELHRERDRYPYCAPLQVVSLLADKAAGAPLWEKQTLPVVTLYVQDTDRLYEQMETLARPTTHPEPSGVKPVIEPDPTGIKNLRVRYNKVFGYYIEVTNSYRDLVPDHYIRRQTLANAEVDRNLEALSKIVTPGSLGNLRKAFIKQFKNHYIANGGKIKR